MFSINQRNCKLGISNKREYYKKFSRVVCFAVEDVTEKKRELGGDGVTGVVEDTPGNRRFVSGPIFNRENYEHPGFHMERHPMPRTLASAIGPTGWNKALDIIAYGSPEQTLQNRRLAHAVKESTLYSLITELLLWLLDERVPRMDDGSQLLKALNVLMLKILDNAERTSSFVVLINLLRPLDPSKWPTTASNEPFAIRNQKFSDLVVKCLIKLTKVLQSTIYDVDLDRILQIIHVYLQELGMEEIRRRYQAAYIILIIWWLAIMVALVNGILQPKCLFYMSLLNFVGLQ